MTVKTGTNDSMVTGASLSKCTVWGSVGFCINRGVENRLNKENLEVRNELTTEESLREIMVVILIVIRESDKGLR